MMKNVNAFKNAVNGKSSGGCKIFINPFVSLTFSQLASFFCCHFFPVFLLDCSLMTYSSFSNEIF